MSVVNLNKTSAFDEGKDGIVIVHYIEGIPGGRSLDVTGFAPNVVRAGHVVIKETATGNFKPMPVSGNSYATLPSGHTVEGVVVASVAVDKAAVGIMVRGSVNEPASPYLLTAEIKTALPLIRFTQD
jgi:hypothetical protein